MDWDMADCVKKLRFSDDFTEGNSLNFKNNFILWDEKNLWFLLLDLDSTLVAEEGCNTLAQWKGRAKSLVLRNKRWMERWILIPHSLKN